MTEVVLSLFPGLGLLDLAFEEAGWCVVRGPDVLWGGDVRRFQPPAGVFGGVIGGPPCQTFSSLAHLVRANGHEPRFGNLIPEFERVVCEAAPVWFLMENVPAAPEPAVAGYSVTSFLLDNSALDSGDGFGHEQRRVRRFSFGMRGKAAPDLRRWVDLAVFLLPDAQGTLTQWTPDNSAEAKGRVRHPAVTSTDGGERPSEQRTRQNAVLAAQSSNPGCTGATTATKARQLARVPPVTAGHEQVAGLNERKRRKAVSSSNGGNGADRSTAGAGNAGKGRYKLADALRLQGLPEDFLKDAPFTADGKLKAVANGVPLPLGRAIAGAIRAALTAAPS